MQVLRADEAAAWVKAGDTVAVCGVVSLLSTEAVLAALEKRFEATGEPRELTVVSPCRTGWSADGATTGLEHLAAKGMLRRLIASAYNAKDTPRLVRAAMDGGIETHVLPMGVLFRWMRECAARSPGLLTEVGRSTFFDPSTPEAGDLRVVPSTPSLDLVRRVDVAGVDCLFVRSLPIDVAIVRGSVADEDGNVSLEDEPITGGVRHMAMAARTNPKPGGGKVIVVVRRIVPRGSLHPRMVEIPALWVDAVVVDPTAIQTQLREDEPAFTRRTTREPVPAVMPLDHQKIILRRAAMELAEGDVVNLGVGMGSQLPAVMAEEGLLHAVRYSVEHGALGGVPAMGVPGQTGAFGASFDPQAIVDSADLMDFYHGGGLDATLLGFAQVDAAGSVNVARFDGAIRGPGGFLDITFRTRKILLCGSLTSGSLLVGVDHGELRIRREGRHAKLLPAIEQVNLHGPSAFARGARLRVITERCVFALDEHGLLLVEVAPGIDIETQVRPHVGFELRCAPYVAAMDARLFAAGRMGLRLPPRSIP